MTIAPNNCSSVLRDFTPRCLTDLAVDYSILLTDDMQSLQRTKLAKKCHQLNLSVITSADLDDAAVRRCFPTRSIFVIRNSKGTTPELLQKQLAGYAFMIVPDFFIESLIDSCVKAQLKFNEIVANRLGLPMSYVSQAPLINGWTNSSSAAGSFGNNIAMIQHTMQAASINGTSFVSTMRGDSAQVLSMVFAIQDMYHLYAPQFSDSVKCDVPLGVSAVVPPTFLNNQSYTPIQMLPMLCDNPSSTLYYVNDCRPVGLYLDNCIPNIPLPRLFIRPQVAVPQIMPNIELAIHKGESVIKLSGELTKGYAFYENIVRASVIMLAKIYYNAIHEARYALELIKDSITNLKATQTASVRPRDFCCDRKVVEKDQSSFPDVDFSKLPITPDIASVYPDLIMDYDELGLVFGYRLLDFSKTKKTWSSWDSQAPLVASPLGSYFLDDYYSANKQDTDQLLSLPYFTQTAYTTSIFDTTENRVDSEIARLRARDSDDVIIIRPARCPDKVIAVPRNGRPFTTFQLINAVAYLCKNMHRINKFTRSSSESLAVPSKRRSMTSSMAPLNKFGIPLRSLFDCTNSASHRRQISEPEDNDEGLQEDRSRGKCAVCGVNYMNYFDHVRSHVHIEKYRELLCGLNIYKPLQNSMTLSEYKVSMHRQLANIIMFVVTREQKPYDVVATKLNECLSAMGSRIQVDPYDLPRSNSPTCRTSSFTTWRERIFRTQQHAFNETLIRSIEYYGDVLTLGAGTDTTTDTSVTTHSNVLQHDTSTIGMMAAIVNGTGAFLRAQKPMAKNLLSSMSTKHVSSLECTQESFQSYCDLLMQATFSSIGFSNCIRATEILHDAATDFFPAHVLHDLQGKIDLVAPIKVPFRGIEDLIPDRVLYKPLHDLRHELMNSYMCPTPVSRDISLLDISIQSNEIQTPEVSGTGKLVCGDTFGDNFQNELIDEYIFQNANKIHHYDSFSAYDAVMYTFYQDFVRESLNFRYGYFQVDDIYKNIVQQERRSRAFGISDDADSTECDPLETFEPLDDAFIKIYRYLAKSFYKLPPSAQNSLNIKIFSDIQESCNENENEQMDLNPLCLPTKIDSQPRNLEAMTESIIHTHERSQSHIESMDLRDSSSKLGVHLSYEDRIQRSSLGMLSYKGSIDTPIPGSDGVESSFAEPSSSLPSGYHNTQQSDLLLALLQHDSETSAVGLIDDSMCYKGTFDAVSHQPIEVRPYVPETMLREDVNTLDTYLSSKTESIAIKPYTLPGMQSIVDISSDASNIDRGDEDLYDHDSIIGGFIKKLSKTCIGQNNPPGSGCTSGQRSPNPSRDKRMEDIVLPTYKGIPLVLPSITRILNTHLPLNQNETFETICELPGGTQGRVILPPEYEIRTKKTPNIEDYIGLFHIYDQGGRESCVLNAILSDDYLMPTMLLREIGGITGTSNPTFYPIVCTLMKTIDTLFPLCSQFQEDHDIPTANKVNDSLKVDLFDYENNDELSMDDSMFMESLCPRIQRSNSIPGPIRLAPEAISVAFLAADSPTGLDIDDPVVQDVLEELRKDLSPTRPVESSSERPIDCGSVDGSSGHNTVTGLYAGPQLYERIGKGKRIEESTTYVSTQLSGSDYGSSYEQTTFPDISVFSTLREAHDTPLGPGEDTPFPRHYTYLTSIIKEIDMSGNLFPQFCTLPRSIIHSINSSLIASYMLGNNALLNACSAFEAVSNSVLGVSTQSAMIQPIHLAILQAGVTSKLRSDDISLGYDCFIKRKYTSKILMEKHPRPSVYDCNGLADELLNILMHK
ncbi:Hypothetical protein GLP15_1514 [Giardia lamblia P15]|uniref:Uncharacterized protein n=1 Tax=Giardia intestinalis (strain P15) TaxID=658858 RepID=E1EYM7_GIAIA|nr:Hypothetical protein GLP15_1514 [Giardia lamblia P15]